METQEQRGGHLSGGGVFLIPCYRGTGRGKGSLEKTRGGWTPSPLKKKNLSPLKQEGSLHHHLGIILSRTCLAFSVSEVGPTSIIRRVGFGADEVISQSGASLGWGPAGCRSGSPVKPEARVPRGEATEC